MSLKVCVVCFLLACSMFAVSFLAVTCREISHLVRLNEQILTGTGPSRIEISCSFGSLVIDSLGKVYSEDERILASGVEYSSLINSLYQIGVFTVGSEYAEERLLAGGYISFVDYVFFKLGRSEATHSIRILCSGDETYNYEYSRRWALADPLRCEVNSRLYEAVRCHLNGVEVERFAECEPLFSVIGLGSNL